MDKKRNGTEHEVQAIQEQERKPMNSAAKTHAPSLATTARNMNAAQAITATSAKTTAIVFRGKIAASPQPLRRRPRRPIHVVSFITNDLTSNDFNDPTTGLQRISVALAVKLPATTTSVMASTNEPARRDATATQQESACTETSAGQKRLAAPFRQRQPLFVIFRPHK